MDCYEGGVSVQNLSNSPCTDRYGCNTCTCSEGDWTCTNNVCKDLPACPTGDPPVYDALQGGAVTVCPVEGQLCASWGECSPVCQCSSGRWYCQWPSCACPSEAPPGGYGPCTQLELYCRYGGMCYRCTETLEGTGWISGPCDELR
jgi:hypothetical protein